MGFVGLPFHGSSYGPLASTLPAPSFELHAETIIAAIARRPGVTDSAEAVTAQARLYLDTRHGQDLREELSLNLVDTAYFARDYTSPRCRALNARLACAWFKEIHCFSDRDQLSLPSQLTVWEFASSPRKRDHSCRKECPERVVEKGGKASSSSSSKKDARAIKLRPFMYRVTLDLDTSVCERHDRHSAFRGEIVATKRARVLRGQRFVGYVSLVQPEDFVRV